MIDTKEKPYLKPGFNGAGNNYAVAWRDKDGTWHIVKGEEGMSYLEAEEVCAHFRAEGDGEIYGVVDTLRNPVPRPTPRQRKLLESFEQDTVPMLAVDIWHNWIMQLLKKYGLSRRDTFAIVEANWKLFDILDKETEANKDRAELQEPLSLLRDVVLAAYTAGACKIIFIYRQDWWSDDNPYRKNKA